MKFCANWLPVDLIGNDFNASQYALYKLYRTHTLVLHTWATAQRDCDIKRSGSPTPTIKLILVWHFFGVVHTYRQTYNREKV